MSDQPESRAAERQVLGHFLGAIAYRAQKALRGAPPRYPDFAAGGDARTPAAILRHMTSVLGYARTYLVGGSYPRNPDPLPSFDAEIARFHQLLSDLGRLLSDGVALRDITERQLLQGPLADVMTHVGQLALLRRLAGDPVPPEDFIHADVNAGRLGPDQPPPARPDADWPERPAARAGAPQELVVIFGPPAVGKMTVGRELSRLSGLPLFHNHLSIEPVLPFFRFGHPAFQRLVREFRARIFEEVVASDLPGLIFTYVWALDDPRDRAFIDGLSRLFRSRGARVSFVELEASLDERLRRNESAARLAAKPSKRDVAASRERLLEAEGRHRLSSDGDFFYPERFLRIDNTELGPEEVALRIVEGLGLPGVAPGGGRAT